MCHVCICYDYLYIPMNYSSSIAGWKLIMYTITDFIAPINRSVSVLFPTSIMYIFVDNSISHAISLPKMASNSSVDLNVVFIFNIV